MWPRSQRLDAAVTQSHTVAIRISLWTPGQKALLHEDLTLNSGGSVTVDRTATTRRSATVNVLDVDGVLARIFRPGARTIPATELVIQRGVRYPDGTSELLPLGVLGVSGGSVKQGKIFALTCYDRARRVTRARLMATKTLAAGQRYTDAAAAHVLAGLGFPVEVVNTSTSAAAIGTAIVCPAQDDRWARAKTLCSSAGAEIFFDQLGRLVIRDATQVVTSPVWSYLDGVTSTLLPDTEWTLTDEPGYNAVVAGGDSSDNTTAVAHGAVYDNDPSSPTYFFGDYGQVPEFYSSPLLTTDAMAVAAAKTRLSRRLGANDTMTLATVPHPAQDVGDVLRVRYYAVDEQMVVGALSMPLDISTAAQLTVSAQTPLET
jgi:hypothetical protein